jgi:dethiobiotin synthetase
MMAKTYFITGTDTGVGKTVLTALWARRLLQTGTAARAVKPFGSGSRSDARVLQAAQHQSVSLDEINPWHFRTPLTPLLAARKDGLRVTLTQALAFLRSARRQCEVLLVEGAGGLLSPLGDQFSSRELILGMRAIPVVVCPNRLGAINQVLLVLNAMPKTAADRARVVLVQQSRPDRSTVSNLELLSEFLGRARVQEMPWLGAKTNLERYPLTAAILGLFDNLVSPRRTVTVAAR